MPLGEEAHLDSKESRHRYDVMRNLLSGCLALLLIVAVFLVVMEIQIQQQNKNTDDTRTAAQSAQDAAERTDTVLSGIIAQLNSPENQKQTQVTRQRLLNLEYALCGGPCPTAKEVVPQTPTVTPSPKK